MVGTWRLIILFSLLLYVFEIFRNKVAFLFKERAPTWTPFSWQPGEVPRKLVLFWSGGVEEAGGGDPTGSGGEFSSVGLPCTAHLEAAAVTEEEGSALNPQTLEIKAAAHTCL